MKIGLISSAVPLINGGGRFIAEWLESELRRRGHQVETILIPNTENPETVLQQMIAFRAINLSDAYERVITFRPPAHVVQHPNKVVWFIHHFRQFYDLWDTPYCNIPNTAFGRSLRAQIFAADNVALNAARHVFTNSRIVKDRLSHFNSISSEVLYPPVLAPQRFRSGAYGGEIVSVCRLEPHKRQHMLVEALAHTRTPVRLRLCGAGSSPAYTDELNETARRLGVADRISIENRWITEDEKIDLLETALASAYVPFDEDSYGYPTLEAAHASRCTISVTDSGGVPEFVTDGVNGMITSPEPTAIAEAFDRLHTDRALARRMGESANAHVSTLGIDWDTVIGKLLS